MRGESSKALQGGEHRADWVIVTDFHKFKLYFLMTHKTTQNTLFAVRMPFRGLSKIRTTRGNLAGGTKTTSYACASANHF